MLFLIKQTNWKYVTIAILAYCVFLAAYIYFTGDNSITHFFVVVLFPIIGLIMAKVKVSVLKEFYISENPIPRKTVLKGLVKNQKVVHFFDGKKIDAIFLEYRDYGFTSVLKEISTGKEYLAFNNEVYLPRS